MFVAHLPSGYLLGTGLRSRSGSRAALWTALAGSVFPDFDLFYFYLVDGRQTLHHHYWTHLPFFWVCVAAFAVWWRLGRVFLAAVMLHLVLDTFAGGILWGWPWSPKSVSWVEVPAVHDWWVWNFVWHWTFAVEIIITAAAILVWRMRMRKR